MPDKMYQKFFAPEHERIEALFMAIIKGDFDTVKRLVKDNPISLLHKTMNYRRHSYGVLHRNSVTELLRERRFNRLIASDANAFDIAALHGQLEILDWLLAKRNYVNMDNSPKDSPLYFAAFNRKFSVVKYLIEEKGMSPNNNPNALMVAVIGGDLNIVSYFIERCDVAPNQVHFMKSMLMNAAECGHLNIVRHLVETCKVQPHFGPNDPGYIETDPLRAATVSGQYEIVRYFIEACGIDPNSQPHGLAALLVLAAEGRYVDNEKLYRACSRIKEDSDNSETDDHCKLVQYFIDQHGADPLQASPNGGIPLMHAVKGGQLKVVRYLIETCGVDCNKIVDSKGNTPLMIAAKNDRLEIVRYFVEDCNADITATNNQGQTALFHCLQWSGANKKHNKEILEYLLIKGGDPRHTDQMGSSLFEKCEMNLKSYSHLDELFLGVYETERNHYKALLATLKNAQGGSLALILHQKNSEMLKQLDAAIDNNLKLKKFPTELSTLIVEFCLFKPPGVRKNDSPSDEKEEQQCQCVVM